MMPVIKGIKKRKYVFEEMCAASATISFATIVANEAHFAEQHLLET